MKRMIAMLSGVLALTLGVPAPAHAQLAVIDSSNLVQALNTARNTLQQIQQAQQLYTALNNVSNIGSVAGILNSPVLKSALPEGMQSTVQLVSADLSELGAIGTQAAYSATPTRTGSGESETPNVSRTPSLISLASAIRLAVLADPELTRASVCFDAIRAPSPGP